MAESMCAFLIDSSFQADCAPYLTDKAAHWYRICKSEMCRNGNKVSVGALCIITQHLAKLCTDKRSYLDREFFPNSTDCGKFLCRLQSMVDT